jgi:recombinational DNA repair ATPase RecF
VIPTNHRGVAVKVLKTPLTRRCFFMFKKVIKDSMKITIDNIEYELDSLSEDAKAQLASLNFVDQKLAQLGAEVAAMQTARIAYSNALNAALPKEGEKQAKH